MVSTLIRNLENYVVLSQEDKHVLAQIVHTEKRLILARRDLIGQGTATDALRLIVSGWACRYKDLPDGRRQIVGLLIPGEFCDLNADVVRRMDHSIGALTNVRYYSIPHDVIDRFTSGHPRITRALLWSELVRSSIQREWLLNLGQRSAFERLAHLFVEMFFRMRSAGMTEGNSCFFPLTQSDLADVTGVTTVHVNRTLQQLRSEGFVSLDRKRLRILDMDRIIDVAMFDPGYLHLDHEGRHLDANG